MLHSKVKTQQLTYATGKIKKIYKNKTNNNSQH